jgi:putative addiction module component (TIGR02574 family)
MSANLINEAKNLPLSQRIELIEALWESIAQEGYEPTLTPEQADELDRRLSAHQQDPDDVISWESVRSDLDSKYRKH